MLRTYIVKAPIEPKGSKWGQFNLQQIPSHFSVICTIIFIYISYIILRTRKWWFLMDDRLFRNAMGNFATGVTVIITEAEGETHGMTANAFMSQSLQPKLITVSLKEDARMLKMVKKSGFFTVNILSKDQQDVSMVFAGQVKDDKEITFDDLNGKPVIPDALAQIVCQVKSEYVEGDHTLFIGQVTDIHLEEGDPLIFFQGKYRTLLQTLAPKQ